MIKKFIILKIIKVKNLKVYKNLPAQKAPNRFRIY